MLAVPVVNMQGESTGQMEIDPALLGGRVRPKLLKHKPKALEGSPASLLVEFRPKVFQILT